MARTASKTPLALPRAPRGDLHEAIGLDLETIDPKSGKVPRNRLRDAKAAHSLFQKCLEGDRKSAHNRTVLQEMADGAPPIKDAVLAQQGMGWVYNLNFLEADSRLAAALASYDDLADSAEHLIAPQAYPDALPVDELTDALDIVSEEFSTMVREGTDFYANWQRLGKEFVGHGVGFAYWPDAETYIWEPAGWDQALIPRKTKARASAITIFITRHEYRANELYKFIDEPAYAAGWNRQEVHKAIVSAARGRRNIRRWYDHWPEIELELKNNDLGFGVADSEVIPALHYWVKEFDGSYSFYIGLEDGTNEEYLFKDLNRYKDVSNAFTPFTLGDGNGFYHSIRGALWKMFPFIQASNRFQNKMLTNTDVSMTLLVQGDEGDSYDDMQITLGPAIGYLPPSAKIVERHLPDVGTQGMPIVHHLGQKLQEGSGQFQAPAPPIQPDAKGNPETKYGIQVRQQTQGSLTANSVNCFYRSMDVLIGEQFRRTQAIGPTGKAMGKDTCCYPPVKEFFKRCKERGVESSFIIKGIRKVTAARAIGNGSPQMRLLALDELAQMAGSLDETGRDLAARDRIALRFGRAMADRYKPRVKRLAPDVTIANIENAALFSEEIPVLPDQNHFVHAGIHVPKFQQIVQEMVARRDQAPEAPITPLQDQLQYAGRLAKHAGQHVQAMAADPLHLADMKSFRAALEQGANLLQGFARELAQEERQATQGGGQPGVPPGKVQSPKDQAEGQFYQQKLLFEAQRNQQELQHKQETHEVELQLKSAQVAQVAQNIKIDQIKADQEIAQTIKKSKVVAPKAA